MGRDQFDHNYAHSAHLVVNPLIDINGQEATGRWYLCHVYETAAGGTGITQKMYRDVYHLTDEGWRIDSSEIHYGAAVGASQRES